MDKHFRSVTQGFNIEHRPIACLRLRQDPRLFTRIDGDLPLEKLNELQERSRRVLQSVLEEQFQHRPVVLTGLWPFRYVSIDECNRTSLTGTRERASNFQGHEAPEGPASQHVVGTRQTLN